MPGSIVAGMLAILAQAMPPAGGASTVQSLPDSAPAESADGFTRYVASLRPRALAAGVRPETFDGALPTLVFDPRVIAADCRQPGGSGNGTGAIQPFAPYRRAHVDTSRIERGRTRYQALRPLLSRIEAQTGVSEAIAMAIWGHETDYGAGTGRYDLLSSLATLAYEGRRRELFAGEYVATLNLLDRGIARETLKGSWAGATGYPQFLPSQVFRLGRDGDGDGRVDIWTSSADALASIGAYLLDAGWKPNVPWGVPVSVPDGLDRTSIAPRLAAPRCPRVMVRHSRWLTVAEWRRLGVVPQGGPVPADGEMASLLEPDGPGQIAYLLTTNYRAILDYNCSNFYALSVGLLADEVGR